MFTKSLTGLTLANKVADGMFKNISGDSYRGDCSFVATLRALMYNRVPKEESISINRSVSSHTADVIIGSQAEACVRLFLDGLRISSGEHGILHIHSFDNSSENNVASFEAVDNGLSDVISGFVPMQDMAKFFEQRKINARFFVNENQNSALIFIDRLDIKKWHLLQSFIPRYFPGYFKENPLQPEEQKLLKSLTIRYSPDYEEQIEAFAKRFDFRTPIIRSKLKGFELNFERGKLRDVRDKINDIDYRLDELKKSFQEYYQKIDDLRTTELGLIEKINRGGDGEDSELLDYFICNKSLNLVDVCGSNIEFIVTTTLSNFDPDMFDSMIRSKRSFFYRHYETGDRYGNDEMTDERIKHLMKAVFEEEILKIRVCAAYMIDFGSGEYAGLRKYSYPEGILVDHTPNQHIDYYACLGNNERVIYDAMRRRDYVSAVAACCGSASNINFSESNTGSYFMEHILSPNVGRIIQMPDGSTMTPLDATKWLEEQDAKTGEKTEEGTHE